MNAPNTAATDLAASIYDAFNRKDFDACLADSTDDITIDLVPFGTVFEGKQGFLEFMQGFTTAFPDIRIAIARQTDAGATVVNECVWSGTHTGPLRGPEGEIPPTGKRVEGARFCEVWEIRDDRLAGIRNYQDVASWTRQLGLI